MDRCEIQNNRGVALMTAVGGTILLTLTAAVILNFTMRRFEITAFRVDRLVAFHADEGATQYVWARLTLDPAFRQEVISKRPPPFVITSDENEPNDRVVPALQMGGKDVTVEILWDNPAGKFRVRAKTDYGT